MEELYRDARRAVVESRSQLEGLETIANPLLSQALKSNLEALNLTAQQLATNLSHEPLHKRDIWRERLVQLDEELNELRRGQDRCASRARRAESEAKMREELLSRRRQRNEAPDTAIMMDPYETEAKSLRSSSMLTDQILETGHEALNMLRAQRGKLKGARTKMLDVANQLGVSKDLIRAIERREVADTYIVLGGIGLLIGVTVLIWYFRSR